MIFSVKLTSYFLLWTLYSYKMHRIAHLPGRYNFIRYLHMKHHAYEYDNGLRPPWPDYFFWFGTWRASFDVYLTFTAPLIILAFIDPSYGATLLAFHYTYEVFFSKNVLDHNPNIKGLITRVVPIGTFHLAHHTYARCNYSFYITLWDYVFQTNERSVRARIDARKAMVERSE